ncbi:MAG: hypothetical protein QOI56_2057 [Actinomycetota bacterium]|nr:hypothetical protein [Actinomycetota bacterium]
MWRIVGVLVAVLLALSVIGLVIKALRFLLIVALVLAVITALVGAGGRRKP